MRFFADVRVGRLFLGAAAACLLGAVCCADVTAAGPRVLPEGELPDDCRLGDLTDLNGYFPFAPSESLQAWQPRAERMRRRLLVCLGLWPMPAKTPLDAVIHGRIERDRFTIEKVYFQSMPGFFVTGNLYRPKGRSGKLAAVACPHGHFSNGRFHDAGLDSVRKQIESGAELFEQGGRSPLQSRCVQLARMGCVVFHYDMVGYADNTQIPAGVAHGFAKQRPDMNARENWGLFGPQAESHFQNVMGLQTFNSIRVLDFLGSLADVDASRIAVTGASGGGTQTFIVCAVDPRPAVAIPAVMVSTAMQGGCTCENACGLRVCEGNVAFAALFAPKPLALTAADDWTKEMTAKGFPELKRHFETLGAGENVQLTSLTQFPHNYNAPSRAAMYAWVNRHLRLGHSEPIEEADYPRLTPKELTVWNDDHPRPDGGDDFERELLAWWNADANRQLTELAPSDAASSARYRQVVGGAVEELMGRGLPDPAAIDVEATGNVDRGTFVETAGWIRHRLDEDRRETLPAVLFKPKSFNGNVVIWIDALGKAGLFDAAGGVRPEIERLVESGSAVVGVDLLYQGEFLADGKPLTQARRVGNPREFAGYTLGFNHSLFAQRVHDILTVVAAAGKKAEDVKSIDLVGLAGAGHWVAAARAVAGDAVRRAAIDTDGFRFAHVADIRHVDLLPGGAKYGDLPGMLALSAPRELWLSGEDATTAPIVRTAFEAAGAAGALTIDSAAPKDAPGAAVNWLLREE